MKTKSTKQKRYVNNSYKKLRTKVRNISMREFKIQEFIDNYVTELNLLRVEKTELLEELKNIPSFLTVTTYKGNVKIELSKLKVKDKLE
tara:strand:+ start:235 stop:501 length:267 start_codon:yes stop_codon:yes gene_type:complete